MLRSKITQTLMILTIASIGFNLTACQKKTDETTNQPSNTDTQVEETIPMSAEPAEPNNSLVANDIETQPIIDIEHNTNADPESVDVIDIEPMDDDPTDSNTEITNTDTQ